MGQLVLLNDDILPVDDGDAITVATFIPIDLIVADDNIHIARTFSRARIVAIVIQADGVPPEISERAFFNGASIHTDETDCVAVLLVRIPFGALILYHERHPLNRDVVDGMGDVIGFAVDAQCTCFGLRLEDGTLFSCYFDVGTMNADVIGFVDFVGRLVHTFQ